VDKAPFGIYRRSDSGSLTMVNPALVQMLGYGTAQEVLELDFLRDVHSDTRSLDELLRSGRDYFKAPRSSIETRFRRKNGEFIVVRVSEGAIKSPNEGPALSEGFVENVTTLRAMERQLQLAQRMDALGQMAGGVAHDFNNVLNLIGVYAELLAEKKNPVSKTRAYARQILGAMHRGAALTKQLLALGRKVPHEPSTISIRDLLKEFKKTFPQMLGKEIRLEIVESVWPLAVRIDRDQWEQVILNLVMNARDSMPHGGVLTIEASAFELPKNSPTDLPSSPNQYVQLNIRDTGIGMDEITLLRIFDPYFTTKPKDKGTGLGLTLVYRIVNQSGGTISVSSAVGEGTDVRILLPQVKLATHQRRKLAMNPPRQRGRNSKKRSVN
jgi:two-component system cell cycle sensor histidine kinase/response regulator CckA